MSNRNRSAERKQLAVRILAGVVAFGLLAMIVLPSVLGR